jgi:hypothetical protein
MTLAGAVAGAGAGATLVGGAGGGSTFDGACGAGMTLAGAGAGAGAGMTLVGAAGGGSTFDGACGAGMTLAGVCGVWACAVAEMPAAAAKMPNARRTFIDVFSKGSHILPFRITGRTVPTAFVKRSRPVYTIPLDVTLGSLGFFSARTETLTAEPAGPQP